MELWAVRSLLVPLDVGGTHFRGFLGLEGGEEFELEAWLGAGGEVTRLDCEWRLKELLRGQEAIIQQQCQLQSRKQADSLVPLPQFYSELITDIEALGWGRVSYIDPTLRRLHLVTTDARQRPHTLKLRLHPLHPSKAPDFSSDLPVPFDFPWTKQTRLSAVLAQFEVSVARLQRFWDSMDALDSKTCVLEPEQPSRGALRRRIALGKAASLQIEVDPLQPCRVPDCRFLGSDLVVGPLKENFNKNVAAWSADADLLTNLQMALGVDFPSLQHSRREELMAECGICYAYRLLDDIPDQTCEGTHCNETFHRTCLSEWLRSLASSRLSFNVLFGECPYCKQQITVKAVSH